MLINKALFSSKTDEWETPKDVFNELDRYFKFTLDPCATSKNAKCSKFYTKEEDGLSKSWRGERVFCNPPYGKEIAKWIKKAYDEVLNGDTKVVLLIPSRTDTKWFHDYIYGKFEIHFIKGRLNFGNSKKCAPFPSMIVIMELKGDNI